MVVAAVVVADAVPAVAPRTPARPAPSTVRRELVGFTVNSWVVGRKERQKCAIVLDI
jgi:hypothetical protein